MSSFFRYRQYWFWFPRICLRIIHQSFRILSRSHKLITDTPLDKIGCWRWARRGVGPKGGTDAVAWQVRRVETLSAFWALVSAPPPRWAALAQISWGYPRITPNAVRMKPWSTYVPTCPNMSRCANARPGHVWAGLSSKSRFSSTFRAITRARVVENQKILHIWGLWRILFHMSIISKIFEKKIFFEIFKIFIKNFWKIFRKIPKRFLLEILLRIFWKKIIKIRSVQFEIQGGDKQTPSPRCTRDTTLPTTNSLHFVPLSSLRSLRFTRYASEKYCKKKLAQLELSKIKYRLRENVGKIALMRLDFLTSW